MMLSYAKPYNEIQHEQLVKIQKNRKKYLSDINAIKIKTKHKKTITIAITQQYLHKRSKGLQPY